MTQAETEPVQLKERPAEDRQARKKKGHNQFGAIAAKKDKASKLRVLVFEPEGGAPYTVEVKPVKGQFVLPNTDQAFKIARGSVWIEDGIARTCVNAANPITVNIHTLTGSDIMHPTSYNTDINNNYAEQVLHGTQTKPFWARGTTWGLLIAGGLVAVLMLWLIKTTGSGLEEIKGAIEGIKFQAEQAANNSGGSGGGGGGQAGGNHNQIAPGGN